MPLLLNELITFFDNLYVLIVRVSFLFLYHVFFASHIALMKSVSVSMEHFKEETSHSSP